MKPLPRTTRAIPLLAFITSSLLASMALADEIPVVNHSFELPVLQPCVFGPPMPGWTNGSTWNPGLGTTCAPLNGFPNGVADGIQTAFVNSVGLPIKQTLNVNVQGGQEYTLLVEVGRRSDCCPMQDYAVRLVADGITLVEDNDSLEPVPGTFETTLLSFTAPVDHPAIGTPIEIHLVLLAGSQANFDNVRFFTGPFVPPELVGDFNGDDKVNASDLAVLLGAWGACGQCGQCPADLNDDCVVNAADLALLLGAWTG
ncbi:MAG: hypothetical protein SGJ11_00545 [Phycisphaerae bacterium]|nr:hypothetical protein [Phycisphaerae bacterium]